MKTKTFLYIREVSISQYIYIYTYDICIHIRYIITGFETLPRFSEKKKSIEPEGTTLCFFPRVSFLGRQDGLNVACKNVLM